MKTRPWPIVVLALLHLLAPIPNGMLSAALQHTTLREYLHQELSRGITWSLVSWLAIFPLAAVAIYMMKRWSYALYLVCMACAVYSNYVAARGFPAYFSMPLSFACIFFDLGMVSYFLIPAVRAGYFNPRLRWWETKPRYSVKLKATASGPWGREQVNLLNVSEGGAFIRSPKSLQKGDVVELTFEVLGQKMHVSGKIVHMVGGDTWGYGIQFELAAEVKKHLRTAVKSLARSGHQDFRSNAVTFQDFKNWASQLLTSGKGWIPEIPVAAAPSQAVATTTATPGGHSESEGKKPRSKRRKKGHLRVIAPRVEPSTAEAAKQDPGQDDKKKAA